MVKSHSSGLLDDPDEEYEYMNKQTHVSLRQNSPWQKSNKKRSMSVSSQATACSCDTTLSMEGRGGLTVSSGRSDSEQQVEYEYMDIRGREKDESPPEHDPPPPPILPRIRREVEDEDEDEYVEDDNYHYTNSQPKLRQALKENKELRIEGRDSSEEYEYEDMDGLAASPPADAGVYQNMQGEGAEGATAVHPSGFELHVKVRAGVDVGAPVAGDRSFDNPGYWHSRMFLKPNAVPT